MNIQNTEIFSGICNGTLGELFQGPYPTKNRLDIAIISFPVPKYSWVYFVKNIASNIDVDMKGREKSKRAIYEYLAYYGKSLPSGRWFFRSELNIGRGMASSTADIVAVIRCLDAIFNQATHHLTITKILKNIERSDGVFINNYLLYLSERQKIVYTFQSSFNLYVCYIDEENPIDTEKTAAKLLDYYQNKLPYYQSNLSNMIQAFQCNDLLKICKCSTTSAKLAQGIFPKNSFQDILSNQKRFLADGIFVAHTGSLIGYLFIERPTIDNMSKLSSFFYGLGYQCHFLQSGIK